MHIYGLPPKSWQIQRAVFYIHGQNLCYNLPSDKNKSCSWYTNPRQLVLDEGFFHFPATKESVVGWWQLSHYRRPFNQWSNKVTVHQSLHYVHGQNLCYNLFSDKNKSCCWYTKALVSWFLTRAFLLFPTKGSASYYLTIKLILKRQILRF